MFFIVFLRCFCSVIRRVIIFLKKKKVVFLVLGLGLGLVFLIRVRVRVRGRVRVSEQAGIVFLRFFFRS